MKTNIFSLFFFLYLMGVFGQAQAANIDVDPLSWDYGDVIVGNSSTTTIRITGADLFFDSEVSNIEIIHDTFGAFDTILFTDPWIISPGELIEFDVHFTPPDVDLFTASS